eukprot:942492_1
METNRRSWSFYPVGTDYLPQNEKQLQSKGWKSMAQRQKNCSYFIPQSLRKHGEIAMERQIIEDIRKQRREVAKIKRNAGKGKGRGKTKSKPNKKNKKKAKEDYEST